ncbi:glycosyl hydrolase family 76-domain-containing protein [Cercophora newfieldiana]|uniref:Mannan endo-1,6-alpha-mannosidase n=1 Tax=Cercophora newfieldiana TaxID=92897 RepID=A0AA39XYU7_9PEZI|nr:glycosyl hydrolase family 76-domain-containing protein [Cercophora newfieldiana]
MAMWRSVCALLALSIASPCQAALEVDLQSPASIRAAAKVVAKNLMSYYHGDEPGMTPGILPGPPPGGPYYWWEGGALWGTMIDYWHYTDDKTYNDKTTHAVLHQANAPANNFMHSNWTISLGNDDQGFWGMSVMLAAETIYPDPPADRPQWLMLAQGVFNTQAHRWDDQHCGGGLRWQIPFANTGYNYKNSIANAILFNMAARLARYTGNDTYADIAEKVWDWMEGVGYIDKDYNIYDGGHVEANCTDIDKAQFSYTPAIFIQGLGFMHNYTNGTGPWDARLTALTKRTLEWFFPDGIAVEMACELDTHVQCTTDMLSFKGYVARFLAQTVQVAPNVHDLIMPVLRSSAAAMVQSCNPDGTCGFRWNKGQYDGLTGAGQQMNALGTLMALLVDEPKVIPPVTNSTGGTSLGDPAAGGDSSVERYFKPITTADRAGAGILTALGIIGITGTLALMSTRFGEGGA